MEKYIQTAEEKMKIWIDNQHWKLELNFQELIYVLNNYSQYINNLHNKIKLTVSQKDLGSYNIEEMIQIKKYVSMFTFSFDNITTINFDILEKLNNIYSNNDINDSIVNFHYKESNSYEKNLETLKKESSSFNELVKDINENMSDIQKFIIIYQRLGKKINYGEPNDGLSFEYDTNSNNNLEGIITGKSVCGGYALILEQALNLVGVKVNSRTGGLMSEGLHAWNQVCIDGKWYNCDLTLDNTQIQNGQIPLKCLKSDADFIKSGYRDTGSLYNDDLYMQEKHECGESYDSDILAKYFEDIYKNSHINSQDNTNMQLDNQENKKIVNQSELQIKNYMKARLKSLTNIQISDNKGYVGNGEMVLKSKQELIDEKEQLEDKIEDLFINNRIDLKEKNRLTIFLREEYKNMILTAPDTKSNVLDDKEQMANLLNQQNQQVSNGTAQEKNEKIDDIHSSLDYEYLIYYINTKCMEQVNSYRMMYDYDELSDEKKEEFDKKILEVFKIELDNNESYNNRKKKILTHVKEYIDVNPELHDIDLYDLIESFDNQDIVEKIEGNKIR